MEIDKITNNIKNLYKTFSEENFIYHFIETFSFYPKNTIARLKGDRNLSNKKNELIWKDKIYYVNCKNIDQDIYLLINSLKQDDIIKKNKIRFIIVTNFDLFLSIDIKTQQSLECNFFELHKFVNFFLPLIGIEKFQTIEESPADIKASNNLGKLYDQILKDNKNFDLEKNRSNINIFFTRLLFLYYSDDSGVFEKNLFLRSISEFTKNDGSDLGQFFYKLFNVLNEKKDRREEYFKKFPFVNGFLFKEKIELPQFTKKTREMIIDNASLDWQNINPDILGSMLQEVVSPEERDNEEMHYTSVPNILKVLDPLILDEIKQNISDFRHDEIKLKKLLKYIYSIKLFDPACGSGNFLIVAYKQLCFLEIEIIKLLREINFSEWQLIMPGIKVSQFFGLEKSHFATETAKLSLWLAEHQMNFFYQDVFEKINPTLPIENNTNIICTNSLTFNWLDLFKKENTNCDLFILGNPPFKSYSKRTPEQKKDVNNYFGRTSKIDYVGMWFLKASDFTNRFYKTKVGFVATNSVNQGEQVQLIWEPILNNNLSIFFAHKSFKWKNNARNNATVTVSIICFSKKKQKENKLVINDKSYNVKNINPYLISAPNLIIKKSRNPIFALPKMTVGEMPRDDGNLLLNLKEKNNIIEKNPNAEKFIRPFVGGEEFIDGKKRWCIWISENNKNEALKIKSINDRVEKVRTYRNSRSNISTKKFANKPYRFVEIRKQELDSIFLPKTSSSNREYIPVGYADKSLILSDALKIIYSPPLYLIAILSSRFHNIWIKNIGGRLETNIRYSTEVIYNNFPIMSLNEDQKKKLSELSLELLDCRDKFFDKNIAFLYNFETMPNSLKRIHQKIDFEVDLLYSKKDFLNDNERLAHLFDIYAKKTLNKELF